MKQAMMLGILTVLFMTLLTACGNSAESNHSQEVQDMTVEIANYMKEHAAWGGSAGARMAAWAGSHGLAAFGAEDIPKPSAVIMQYTGLGEYGEGDPATFVTVEESDGFGLGTGTVAEGWIGEAIAFWQRQV